MKSYSEIPPIIGHSPLGRFFGSAKFLKMLLKIALPVAIQNLITTTINMIDTVMITPLGSHAITAVAQMNQYVFFFTIFALGVNTAGSIFYAQYHGRGDAVGIRQILRICFRLSLAVGILFTAVSLLFPQFLLRLMAPSPELIPLAGAYLEVILWTFPVFAITQVFSVALRSIGRPKVSMYASILAFGLNVMGNYLLIYGNWGFPALGVRGAALATLIARIAEMLFVLVYVFRTDAPVRFPLRDLLKRDPAMSRQYFRFALPVIFNEAFWSFSLLLFSVAYVLISVDGAAAVKLSETIQGIFFILTISLSTASAVTIGASIGAGEDKEKVLVPMGTRILRLTVLIGVLCSMVELFLPNVLLLIFQGLTPEVEALSAHMLQIRGIFLTFRFLNVTLMLGIFRSGGDVKVPMWIELATTWLYAFPLLFIGGLYFQVGIYWAIAFVASEDLVKFIIFYLRYRRKSWMNQV